MICNGPIVISMTGHYTIDAEGLLECNRLEIGVEGCDDGDNILNSEECFEMLLEAATGLRETKPRIRR